MKITSVKAFPASSPTTVTRNFVFVKIETDEGITGWGEATCGPLAAATMIEEFGKVITGCDPMEIERHWQTLYHHFHVRGGVIQMCAISGIEIALWDIKGQALGAPVYELLGGRVRDRIWTYGRWDGPTPELAVENAMNHVERGLTALKGDPFEHRGIFIDRDSEDLAIAKMKAVREAVGNGVELLVEVHGRLSPSDAIRVGNRLEEYRPFFYEEPVPPQNLDALKKVCGPCEHPHRDRRAAVDQVRFRRAVPAACGGSHPAGHRPGRRHPGTQEDRRDGRGTLRRHPTPQLLRTVCHHRVASPRRVYAELPHPGRGNPRLGTKTPPSATSPYRRMATSRCRPVRVSALP